MPRHHKTPRIGLFFIVCPNLQPHKLGHGSKQFTWGKWDKETWTDSNFEDGAPNSFVRLPADFPFKVTSQDLKLAWKRLKKVVSLHVCQYHSYDIKSISNFERAELFVINWCIAFKHAQIEPDWWEKIQQNSLISSTHPRWKGVFRLVRGDLFIWRRHWVAASLFMKGGRWSGLGMGRAIFRFYLEPQTVPRVHQEYHML